jgi:hypothetical protein
MEASLMRVSRGGITLRDIEEMPLHDFWVRLGAFSRMADEERRQIEDEMAKHRER